MSGPVFLHAGAQRSASSAFQMFLDVNREAIRAQGIDLAYPNRDGAAHGRLKLRFAGARHGEGQVEARLRASRNNLRRQNPSGGPLILSEENVPGRFMHFLAGQFYPQAEIRQKFLVRLLEGRPVARLTLVLRPYAGLFASAARKRAEAHDIGDFRDVAARMVGCETGWPEVIALMQAHLAPEEIRILRYRRRPQAEIAAEVCPVLSTEGLVEYEAPVNASFSDAALYELARRFRAGQALDDAAREAVRAEFADRDAPPFAQFDADQTKVLDEKFFRDMARLRAMSGLSFEGDF